MRSTKVSPFERRDHGVLLITINRPDKFNAADERMHWELGHVWLDVAEDPDIRVAVITGAGKAFSAGGDIEMERRNAGDLDRIIHTMKDARDIVYNIINCDKPVISAINGVAVGAGLAVALLADISIIGEEVRFTDGHLRIGLAAGDHAAIIWPLLCGMAKAKYYLLTADFITGKEAERIGLVSKCVPLDQLMDEALAVATKLATGPAAGRAMDQALTQSLGPGGRPDLRGVARPRDAQLLRCRPAGGARRVRREAAPIFPLGCRLTHARHAVGSSQRKKPCPDFLPSLPSATMSFMSFGGAKRSP